MDSIKRVFQTINTNKNLQKVVLENEDFLKEMPDGGGSLTGYFQHQTLVKISEWIGLSYGIKQIDYYFNNKKLIFAYLVEQQFKVNDSTGSMDPTHPKIIFTGRFYFDNDKLINKILKGSPVFIDLKVAEQYLIKDAKAYSQILYSKEKRE